MKNLNLGKWAGIMVAAVTGIAAFVTAITEKQKSDKIDELIEKVDKL